MDVISNASPQYLRRLREIMQLDTELAQDFNGRLCKQPALNRQIVSFQANKERPGYRWYKYKEAFSASLVEYLLLNYPVPPGPILDPFAGMGTTLFASSSLGFDSDGIELLPIGQQIIQTRLALKKLSNPNRAALQRWLDEQPWKHSRFKVALPVLRITKGAYPPQTLVDIERFIGAWQAEKKEVQHVLRFALLCVLESVSFTRKDGQYLRWDHRSGRREGLNDFNKGRILPFDEAISNKLREILIDSVRTTAVQLFADEVRPGIIKLIPGSCLDVLPSLSDGTYSAIITSPPYCNRYDYTRTYALELAALDVDEIEWVQLISQRGCQAASFKVNG
jgi:DNA modification methylase